jgi:hypothetical protein
MKSLRRALLLAPLLSAAAFVAPAAAQVPGPVPAGPSLPTPPQLPSLELKPVPGPQYTIRMTDCKTYWLPKLEGEKGYEQVEICFGFEKVPLP